VPLKTKQPVFVKNSDQQAAIAVAENADASTDDVPGETDE
jgi:hypothetical protein